MPRPHRVQAPNVTYHVTARGVDRQAIFDVVPGDRTVFLRLFGRTVERYGWVCHAYCLMGNHFHLVVETPQANIAAGMQFLNGSYARWFNVMAGREGHLFERRYGAELAETEGHLLEVSRYVVLNPVRARLCARPEQWPWSSYSATIGLVDAPTFLSVEKVVDLFGGGERGRMRYAHFVAEALDLGAQAA